MTFAHDHLQLKPRQPSENPNEQARSAGASGSGYDTQVSGLSPANPKNTYAGQSQALSPLQCDTGGAGAAGAHAVAARGMAGSGGKLPHMGQIQQSFGRFDVSGIKAHTDGAAAEATGALGAKGYAHNGAVALAPGADLHTTAHEAAHVFQQRSGVQLKGGVGEAGDTYERQADAVADAVVKGESAEPLLAQYGPGSAVGEGVVQLKGDGAAKDAPGRECSATNGSPLEHTMVSHVNAADAHVDSARNFGTILRDTATVLTDLQGANQRQRSETLKGDETLATALRRHGEPDVISMLLKGTVGLVGFMKPVKTLLDEVEHATKLAAFALTLGSGRDAGGLKRLLGGKDTRALSALQAEVKRVNGALEGQSKVMESALRITARGNQVGVHNALRFLSVHLDALGRGFVLSAACGPAYPAVFLSNLQAMVQAVTSSGRSVLQDLVSTESLLSALPLATEHDQKHGGGFLKFMRARGADGSLGDFQLRQKQPRVQLSGFKWVEAPGDPTTFYSSVSAKHFPGKNHHLRVPAKYASEVAKFAYLGAPEGGGRDFWLSDSQYRMLQQFHSAGLPRVTSSVIDFQDGVAMPQSAETKDSLSSWWNATLFKDMYLSGGVAPVPASLQTRQFGGIWWEEREASIQPTWTAAFARSLK